ncbi:hypothetical protein ACFE04_023358 [Oxalis oulophora]
MFYITINVKTLEEDFINISINVFQVVNEETAEERVEVNTILSDVIGCFVGIGGFESVSKGHKKREIEIIIDLFKVHVKVEDASEKTTFVIFNTAGEIYLDTSTHKLFNRQALGSNDFPSKLYNLCNKELIFKLTLNKNIYEGFEDFGVPKIFELDEKFKMERKGKGVLINSATEQQSEIEEDSMSEKVGGIEIGQGIWTKVQQMTAFALTSNRGLHMLEKIGFTAGSTTSAGRFHCWEYNIYGFSAICKLTSMYLICPCPFFRVISTLWYCWERGNFSY